MTEGASFTILNVDDNAAARYFITRILQQAGFLVREAATGAEALRLLADDPDLVILDVCLPDIDGFEVCRRMKADPTTAAIPVLHISACRTDFSDRAIGFDSGADAYVTSPLEPPELLAQVRALLRLRRLERSARASEEQFRAVFYEALDPLVLVDSAGRFADVNPAACELFGLARDQLVGRRLADFGPAGADPLLPGRRRAEIRITRPDGGTRDVEYIAAGDREPGRHLLVLRDVTRHKRAAENARFLAQASDVLASSLDYERTLATAAELAVPYFADWCSVNLVTEDGTIRNVAMAHIDPSKVAMARELGRRYPPDPAGRYGVANVLRTGQPELLVDIPDSLLEAAARDAEHLRMMRSLGLKSYLSVPLIARGRTLGAITFVTTESGYRYGPEDLELAQDLSRRAAVAIDNARLYQEVQEADRRKIDFLATLGHELRNPLAPIRNGLYLLRVQGHDPATFAWAAAMAERQLGHLARLVDDLLDVARISRGKIRLRLERCDLTRLVRSAVEDHRAGLEEAGLTLEVRLPDGPVWVRGDPTRLTQVLANLLANAAKFTDRGGQVTVSLAVEGTPPQSVLRVRDTGIGIQPEVLPHVFEMFAQGARAVDRSRGGLGLGLSLVKGLAEMHGGEVQATSGGPGQGAELCVSLPLEDVGDQPPPAAEAARAPSRGLRVLVVEDEADTARSMQLLLGLYGHQVRLAYSGPEAVAAAQEFRPEVVVCDLGLPGFSGYEVAAALRRDPATASVRLVAVSGFGQDEARRRTREAGFDLHLTKPVDPEELNRLLLTPDN